MSVESVQRSHDHFAAGELGWRMIRRYGQTWKTLALTDLAFKLLAFAILTPIVSLSLRFFVGLSGRDVLADEDIAKFLQEPIGWITLIVVAGLGLAIFALEQATLLAVLAQRQCRHSLVVLPAMHFAARHLPQVVWLTTRIVIRIVLTSLPFVALAGVTYWVLLTKHDINFYLAARPPSFWLAVAIGVVLAGVLVLVVLFRLSGWLFALPILLFESSSPGDALTTSSERTRGRRIRIFGWLVIWFAATTFLSGLVSSVVFAAGRLIVPSLDRSLAWVLLGVGLAVIGLSIVNLLAGIFRTTTLTTVYFTLYHDFSGLNLQDKLDSSLPRSTGLASRLRVTPTRLAVVALIGLAASAWIGYRTLDGIQFDDEVEITAHRGGAATAPENTMAAIRNAIEAEADWVEIDVQENADGDVIVVHDSDFKRLAGDATKVWDSTNTQLAELDIGSSFSTEFSGERVPTLAEVLAACHGHVKVNIELKYYGHDQALERKVVEIVERAGMQEDIVVMSLKQQGLEKIRQLRPAWTYGLLTAVKVGDLTRADADFLAVNASLVTVVFVQSAHAADKHVHAWTVNDALTMSVMIDRGVDNLITDRPALARSVLVERAEMSVPERISLGLAGVFGIEPQVAATEPGG